jgi:hypothetical protein
VKIEFSGRNETEPSDKHIIRPYLAQEARQSGELAKAWLYQDGVETKVNPDTLLAEN